MMEVFHYKDLVGNLGDDLNSWMWGEVAPWISDVDNEACFLGGGSIVDARFLEGRNLIVFGSGVEHKTVPNVLHNPKIKVSCVRGKLTARLLGLDDSLGVADAVILISTVKGYEPLSEGDKAGIIFVPHHRTVADGDWRQACKMAGVELVDPRRDSKEVLQKIRHSKFVIAESMHAAIMADAFRVPWVPVVASHNINTFKWLDFMSSVELEYKPHYIGHASLLREVENQYSIHAGKSMYKPDHKFLSIESLLTHSKRKHIKASKLWVQKTILRKKLEWSKTSEKQNTSDAKQINLVAERIKEACYKRCYLSEGRIFYRNLNALQGKLEELKKELLSSM